MENLLPYVLLGLLLCPPALLVKPFVHFYPLHLNLTEGETARFTCSVSNPDLGEHLVWYKQGHDLQPVKLDGGSQKYRFSRRDNRTYEMEIGHVEKNDSGAYYCWVPPFHAERTTLESNRSNLIVTEKAAATPPPDEMKDQDEDVRQGTKNSFSDLRGSGLLVLLVVLYFLLWVIRRRRQKQKEQKHGNAPLEEVEPPAVTVFTVDYEMLAFPGGPKTKPAASPKPAPREPTEYATIAFLPKTPEAAEVGDGKQAPCSVCVHQP